MKEYINNELENISIITYGLALLSTSVFTTVAIIGLTSLIHV